MSNWTRWLRFNVVGAGGAIVQIVVVGLLVGQAGVHYAIATPAGIALALAHNFIWHRRWTWGDRPMATGLSAGAAAFVRFAGSNGLVSLGGQTVAMALLVDVVGLPALASAAVAIMSCSAANFALAGAVTFRDVRRTDRVSRTGSEDGSGTPSTRSSLRDRARSDMPALAGVQFPSAGGRTRGTLTGCRPFRGGHCPCQSSPTPESCTSTSPAPIVPVSPMR
jgi:putative flippase GtrA